MPQARRALPALPHVHYSMRQAAQVKIRKPTISRILYGTGFVGNGEVLIERALVRSTFPCNLASDGREHVGLGSGHTGDEPRALMLDLHFLLYVHIRRRALEEI